MEKINFHVNYCQKQNMSELNVKCAKRMRCMSHEFWSESSADFNANWKYLKKAVNG